jgi:hypothetical protein
MATGHICDSIINGFAVKCVLQADSPLVKNLMYICSMVPFENINMWHATVGSFVQ